MTSAQLKARRKKIVLQMRELDDGADPETGGMSDEAQTAFDALKMALAQLEIAITRTETIEGLERRSVGTPLDGRQTRATVRVGGRDTALPDGFDGRCLETQDGRRVPVLEARHRLADFIAPEERSSCPISFGGFLRALHSGPRDDVERRALAEATIGTGGAMVPLPLSLQVIDLLRSQAVSFRAGVGTVPMESATLRFARQIADPVGSWRQEAAPITISAPVFDQPTLTAKTWALLVQVSRELLEDGQNLDSILQNIFAKVAALALDRAILYGDGVTTDPNGPVGITNTPGIQVVTMGTNGAALSSRTPLLAGIQALQLANSYECQAFVMSPETSYGFNSLVDTLGQPLRVPDSIADIPTYTTTSASTTETQGTATNSTSIIMGDWSTVFVGMRTALQVTILQERYADTGQVGFVLWMRADVLLTKPAAMCRVAGILPGAIP